MVVSGCCSINLYLMILSIIISVFVQFVFHTFLRFLGCEFKYHTVETVILTPMHANTR